MDGLTWIIILVTYVLATARLTRLVNADVLTDSLRIAVARKYGADSTASYFLSCPWCVSVWVALILGLGILGCTDASWLWLPLIVPAASHLTGLLSALDTDEVEIVDG